MLTYTGLQSRRSSYRRWPLARIVSLVLIILTALVIIGFFWFGGLFAPEEGPPPPEVVRELEAYDKSLSVTRNIVIEGRDAQGRPYRITAIRTRRDERRKHITQLFDVQGKLQGREGSTIYFRADRGDVNHDTNQMELIGNVLIRKGGGWSVRAPQVRVDTETRDMISEHPVVVRMNDTTIYARGMRVEGEGQVVRFAGPVRARFHQPVKSGASSSRSRPRIEQGAP